jgi:hypothetical protein
VNYFWIIFIGNIVFVEESWYNFVVYGNGSKTFVMHWRETQAAIGDTN